MCGEEVGERGRWDVVAECWAEIQVAASHAVLWAALPSAVGCSGQVNQQGHQEEEHRNEVREGRRKSTQLQTMGALFYLCLTAPLWNDIVYYQGIKCSFDSD